MRCVCVRACVHVWVRVCVCACMRLYVLVSMSLRFSFLLFLHSSLFPSHSSSGVQNSPPSPLMAIGECCSSIVAMRDFTVHLFGVHFSTPIVLFPSS